MGTAQHWDGVYASRDVTTVSWFQARPEVSLRLVAQVTGPSGGVVDVGAGASSLADELLAAGWTDVTVLDVSEQALERVRARTAHAAPPPALVVADVLAWQPDRSFATWHDRAVLHFLTGEDDRRRYVAVATAAVRPGGHVVLATFAEDGPQQCSGLPTARYGAEQLAEVFSDGFALVHAEREEHRTPSGDVQPFTWVVLRRRDDGAGPAQALGSVPEGE